MMRTNLLCCLPACLPACLLLAFDDARPPLVKKRNLLRANPVLCFQHHGDPVFRYSYLFLWIISRPTRYLVIWPATCTWRNVALFQEKINTSDLVSLWFPPNFTNSVVLLLDLRTPAWALFTSKNFYKIGIVALSFVFDKYCPIID